MKYNIDGFNERNNYIHNNNDLNRLKNNSKSFDNSFAKMRVEENKNLVTTSNNDQKIIVENAKGKIENFVLMSNNIKNAKSFNNQNNFALKSMQNNMFKR